ncbi:MAG: hypothetical protein LBQ09_11530 [Acidobacteriaceae bacterium]|jgi:NADH-quinone oxidoreductase subunit M|nr:hypothetical protein [Acidobacteriaceae bacterium]
MSLLSAILLVLVAGAVAVAFLPAAYRAARSWFVVAVAALSMLMSVSLWTGYDAQNAAFQFLARVPLVGAIGFDYFVGLDGFSMLLVVLTALVGVLVAGVAAAGRGLSTREAIGLLLLQAALVGAFAALDLLLFFVCVVTALLAVWLLMGDEHPAVGRATSRRGFALSSGCAAALLLAAILAVYVQSGVTSGVRSFDMTALHKLHLPLGAQVWIAAAFFITFAILLPLLSFEAWFAQVDDADRLPARLVVAALMTKIGSYGLIRIALPVLPDAAGVLAPYLAWVAIVVALYAAVQLFRVRSWGRAIAYLSLLQMAVLILGTTAFNDAGLGGAMLMHVAHGVAMSALLVSVGDRDAMPGAMGGAVGVLLAIAIVVAAGVPYSGTGAGVRLVMQGLSEGHAVWAIAVPALMAVSAAAMLGQVWVAFTRASGSALPRAEAGVFNRAAAVVLLAVAVWMGVRPAPFLDRLRIAAHHVVSHVNPAAGNAADCDTIPTPEAVSGTAGSQFLSAVPCGPNGEPLPAPQSPK